jgi:hypothetical protein
MELTVIAAVVIGGTTLAGGEGYVFGALFGVLITILIQTMIQIQGTLITWWTLITVGLITLFFIGLQSIIANLKIGRATGAKISRAKRNRQVLLYGGGAVVVVVLAVAFYSLRSGSTSTVSSACQLQPFRQDQAASLMKGGAVIAYERNGGAKCIDELYAIYSDGRIVGDNGTQKIEKQVAPDDVGKLLSFISNLGWFTDNMYSTSHLPCSVCYHYFASVAYKGQEKTVEAVDGGTDAPAEYWLMTGQFSTILPSFAPAP